jgi:FAD/FMN-containing dehydrogenase
LIDSYPALIVRCADHIVVVSAVQFARRKPLPIAVRSGGHSMAGYGTNEDGLVIDLSSMKAMAVDPVRRIARIEPGLTWGEVSNALQPYGLALTAGDTASVGVGGLLLGGGIGWMVRK